MIIVNDLYDDYVLKEGAFRDFFGKYQKTYKK